MRVVIVGAGEVGIDLAHMLSIEKHDVVLVDISRARLDEVSERLDVMTVTGSGTSVDALEQGGVRQADLLVAVTAVDEVNIIACMLGDRMGVGTTVARVRSAGYEGMNSLLRVREFGIDHVINPEQTTADEIVRLIRRAGATEVLEFAGGRVLLVGMRLEEHLPVVDGALHNLAVQYPDLQFRVMGISRGIRTLIPRGSEILRRGDQIFVLMLTGEVKKVLKAFGKGDRVIQDLMILGGNEIGARIAAQLAGEKGKRIKIVESDAVRARMLAERLPGVLVFHGDPTDVDLLAVEGIAEMDALISVTDDEESNLVTCLLAKHLGVRKTVSLLSKTAYIPIGQRIGLDAAVSKKQAISREILRFMRGTHVLSVATVHGLDAEILELRAAAGSKVTRQPVSEMKLPKGVLLGSVVSDKRTEIVTGSTQVEAGEVVIVFSLPHMVDEVQKWFY